MQQRLVLIVLAVGLWIAEAFVPEFGILGIGGIVAFLLGSLILFDVPGERLVVDPHMLTTVGTLLLCGDGSLGLPPDDGMESCASHGY